MMSQNSVTLTIHFTIRTNVAMLFNMTNQIALVLVHFRAQVAGVNDAVSMTLRVLLEPAGSFERFHTHRTRKLLLGRVHELVPLQVPFVGEGLATVRKVANERSIVRVYPNVAHQFAGNGKFFRAVQAFVVVPVYLLVCG